MLLHCLKEVLWLQNFVHEVFGLKLMSTILSDNQSALSVCRNPVHHQRTKHIDLRYFHIRQELERNSIDVDYVKSEDNLSDVFNKYSPGPTLEKGVLYFQSIHNND
eukprot:Pgem_evm1s10553